MNINHTPIFYTKRVEELYTQKDGVEVKYVCTSALNDGTLPTDVFYRETPHPQHGNRYFALYHNPHFAADNTIMITNADCIEDLEFGMIEGSAGWEYSQHRHDYCVVGDCAIDGGRAYFKRAGNLSAPAKYMKIVDGKFVEIEDE